MARRADLAARAAAVAADPADQDKDTDPTPVRTSAVPQVRTRPVRITVELSPLEHRKLRRLCDQYADQLGAAQVAGAEVVRVLLALVDADETLAARVGDELARTGGNRRR